MESSKSLLKLRRDTIYMDNVIRIFMINNQLFEDTSDNAIEKHFSPKKFKFPTKHEIFLTPIQNEILNVINDFFNEQNLKSHGNRYLRKVFTILSKKIERINFVTNFSHSFWRLESNLRIPLLQLIHKNDYYLAYSLENNCVYLIPNDFIFSSKIPNNYEKIEY